MSSFAEDQVTRLETLLQENVGIAEIRQGDRVIRYDDLLKQYDYWKTKVASSEGGTRPRAATIQLDGF